MKLDLSRFWTVMVVVSLSLFWMGAEPSTATKQAAAPAAKRTVAGNAPQKQNSAGNVAAPAKKPSAAPAKKRPAKRNPNQILVQVNGVNITWRQLERHLDMMLAVMRNRKGLAKDKIAQFRKKNIKPVSDTLLQRTVMDTCLKASNVVVTAGARAEVEREYLKRFGKKGQTFPQLKEHMAKAGFAKEFDATFDFDARLKTFLTTVHSNTYYVSEAYLEKVKADIAAFNKRAAATNRLTEARAADILKRARAGEDFGKLANAFSEDTEKEPGGALGDCDASDFADDKEVWNKLNAMKPGEISDLFTLDDGYAIFKIVKRNTAEESQTGGASVTLARIFFRRAYFFEDQDDDELRADVEQEVRNKLLMNVYKQFRAQSKVIYPNGHVKAQ